VRSWAGDLTKAPLIEALVKKIDPLKLSTVNEVLIVCKGAKPGSGERAAGAGRKPGLRIETPHLKFSIPPNTTPEELLEVAGKLMTMAQEMVNTRQEEAANATAAASNGHAEQAEKIAA
jgi:hypothetical protein